MHFTTEYDFFRYKGKTRCASYDKFQLKREKPLWESLARKFATDDELVYFAVANNINNNNSIFAFDEETYVSWRKKTESLDYHFKSQIEELSSRCEGDNINFGTLFHIEKSNHPKILKHLLSSNISIESFIILDYILGLTKRFDMNLQNDIVWQTAKTKIAKYKPFLTLSEKQKYRDIVMAVK